MKRNHFQAKIKLIKSHNSQNNKGILPQIEIIIYLCIKYESNTIIFAKDNERKSSFETDRTYVRKDSGDTIYYLKNEKAETAHPERLPIHKQNSL